MGWNAKGYYSGVCSPKAILAFQHSKGSRMESCGHDNDGLKTNFKIQPSLILFVLELGLSLKLFFSEINISKTNLLGSSLQDAHEYLSC